MRKKTSEKSSREKGKPRRKLSDLAPKRVRDGDANSVKGGLVPVGGESQDTGHKDWITI
jgi:hypothetical protein